MMRLALPKKAVPRVAIGQPLPPYATERDLEDLVLLHLAHLPWARFWRNKERHLAVATGSGFVPGLAKGSADLVGVVRRGDTFPGCLGVFTAIELKAPGKKPRPDQDEWMSVVRKMGGVAEWTDSLVGALTIVSYARGIPVGAIVNQISVDSGRTVLV